MAIFPIPRLMADTVYDITPETLRGMGVDFLLLDVDNTIAPYGDDEAGPELIAWAERFRGAGIELFILSNSRGHRPEVFASALGIGYRRRAWKPFTKALREVLRGKGISPSRAALLGDQIYTDTLCAAWGGISAIVVHPICLENPLLAFRYRLEFPFRLIYKLRHRHG